MNPMSLIVVLCSKMRRPAPIRRRARATAANTSPWRRNCSARPIARLKVGARLETSLERVASGAAVTSPRAARFICASSSAAIGWSWGGPWATSGANEPQVGAKQNAGGCFAHWAGSVKEPAPTMPGCHGNHTELGRLHLAPVSYIRGCGACSNSSHLHLAPNTGPEEGRCGL